jgi:hypothetical protein
VLAAILRRKTQHKWELLRHHVATACIGGYS